MIRVIALLSIFIRIISSFMCQQHFSETLFLTLKRFIAAFLLYCIFRFTIFKCDKTMNHIQECFLLIIFQSQCQSLHILDQSKRTRNNSKELLILIMLIIILAIQMHLLDILVTKMIQTYLIYLYIDWYWVFLWNIFVFLLLHNNKSYFVIHVHYYRSHSLCVVLSL